MPIAAGVAITQTTIIASRSLAQESSATVMRAWLGPLLEDDVVLRRLRQLGQQRPALDLHLQNGRLVLCVSTGRASQRSRQMRSTWCT